MAKACVEARGQHGESELLDEIVAAKPERDHTRYHSVEELKQHRLQHLRDAVELLERKTTPKEVEDYRRFVSRRHIGRAARRSATLSGRRSRRSLRVSATPTSSRLWAAHPAQRPPTAPTAVTPDASKRSRPVQLALHPEPRPEARARSRPAGARGGAESNGVRAPGTSRLISTAKSTSSAA